MRRTSYIELNPVRAGIADRPADYPWSSHAVNVGTRSDTLVTPHPEFIALSDDPPARQAAYRELFQQELGPSLLSEIRGSTNAGYPLASESFKASLSDATSRKLERGKSGRPSKQSDKAGDSLSEDLLPEIGL